VELGVLFQRRVEGVGVGTMVLLMVDLHGTCVDVGFQSVIGIPQVRKLEGEGHLSGLLFKGFARWGGLRFTSRTLVHPDEKRFSTTFPRGLTLGAFSTGEPHL
jgi:hypothetical protein